MRYLSVLVLLAVGAGVAAPVQAQGMTPEQIKPILEMTKANWVVISTHMGNDLLYFTHLESWRCGIESVRYGLNGAPAETVYPILPCDPDRPNAIPADHLPYLSFDLEALSEVRVSVTYTDGSVAEMSYGRADILQ